MILLAALNAKYIHAAFGLRCLAANMGALESRTRIAEFDINQRPLEIAEKILAASPAIVGLGVYVWNARPALEVVRLLKRIAPEIPIVLGGPEVSHETAEQEICALADVVITGEADLEFARVCRQLLGGMPPPEKIVAAELPDLARLESPYRLYGPEDLAHRIVYVEASRGCPFRCEFCLSSRAGPVRQFPPEKFLDEMDALLRRGARQFKFVDRTFNLHLETALSILAFFERRYEPGLFLHFEIVPDRVPEPLMAALGRFPAGALQLEAGVQTFNAEAAALINRRQDYGLLEANLRALRERTQAHLHADLIAGLPGEDLESFARGFDRLLALNPHEIQVGILKRLRGTSLSRHTEPWGMVYSPEPPYEILCNRLVGFPEMQRLRRFAKYWDALGNSGNFRQSVRRLWDEGGSPFRAFMAFADWAHGVLNRTDSIALATWARLLGDYLTQILGREPEAVRAWLRSDFEAAGRAEIPPFLRGGEEPGRKARGGERLSRRQQRHRPG